MKYLTAPKALQLSTNCGGPLEIFWDQTLEVEPSDVGQVRPHYLGYQHREYMFVKADVGRRITNRQQGNHYQCWWFEN
jgi:hypothetical protein